MLATALLYAALNLLGQLEGDVKQQLYKRHITMDHVHVRSGQFMHRLIAVEPYLMSGSAKCFRNDASLGELVDAVCKPAVGRVEALGDDVQSGSAQDQRGQRTVGLFGHLARLVEWGGNLFRPRAVRFQHLSGRVCVHNADIGLKPRYTAIMPLLACNLSHFVRWGETDKHHGIVAFWAPGEGAELSPLPDLLLCEAITRFGLTPERRFERRYITGSDFGHLSQVEMAKLAAGTDA